MRQDKFLTRLCECLAQKVRFLTLRLIIFFKCYLFHHILTHFYGQVIYRVKLAYPYPLLAAPLSFFCCSSLLLIYRLCVLSLFVPHYRDIRQVSWEMLKTEAGGRGFQHLPRDLANVNALKNHVRSLLLHKTFATFRVISCTILFRLFTEVSRTLFPRTMLVPGPGTTHLVTAAILWPRYRHIESCVAVH